MANGSKTTEGIKKKRKTRGPLEASVSERKRRISRSIKRHEVDLDETISIRVTWPTRMSRQEYQRIYRREGRFTACV